MERGPKKFKKPVMEKKKKKKKKKKQKTTKPQKKKKKKKKKTPPKPKNPKPSDTLQGYIQFNFNFNFFSPFCKILKTSIVYYLQRIGRMIITLEINALANDT